MPTEIHAWSKEFLRAHRVVREGGMNRLFALTWLLRRTQQKWQPAAWRNTEYHGCMPPCRLYL